MALHLGLRAEKLLILAQLHVIVSSFWATPPYASALKSILFQDITSLTNTGLMLAAAAVASFCETANEPVSSISFRTAIILAVSGFVMGGATRFAFRCNVSAL